MWMETLVPLVHEKGLLRYHSLSNQRRLFGHLKSFLVPHRFEGSSISVTKDIRILIGTVLNLQATLSGIDTSLVSVHKHEHSSHLFIFRDVLKLCHQYSMVFQNTVLFCLIGIILLNSFSGSFLLVHKKYSSSFAEFITYNFTQFIGCIRVCVCLT